MNECMWWSAALLVCVTPSTVVLVCVHCQGADWEANVQHAMPGTVPVSGLLTQTYFHQSERVTRDQEGLRDCTQQLDIPKVSDIAAVRLFIQMPRRWASARTVTNSQHDPHRHTACQQLKVDLSNGFKGWPNPQFRKASLACGMRHTTSNATTILWPPTGAAM